MLSGSRSRRCSLGRGALPGAVEQRRRCLARSAGESSDDGEGLQDGAVGRSAAVAHGRASATTGTSCGSTGAWRSSAHSSSRRRSRRSASSPTVTTRWPPSLRGNTHAAIASTRSSSGRFSRRPRSTSRTVRQWKRRSPATNTTGSRRTPGCTGSALLWNLEHPCARELGKAWLEGTRRTSIQITLAPRRRVAARRPDRDVPARSDPPHRRLRDGSLGDSSGDPPCPRGHRSRTVRIHPHSRKEGSRCFPVVLGTELVAITSAPKAFVSGVVALRSRVQPRTHF